MFLYNYYYVVFLCIFSIIYVIFVNTKITFSNIRHIKDPTIPPIQIPSDFKSYLNANI